MLQFFSGTRTIQDCSGQEGFLPGNSELKEVWRRVVLSMVGRWCGRHIQEAQQNRSAGVELHIFGLENSS